MWGGFVDMGIPSVRSKVHGNGPLVGLGPGLRDDRACPRTTFNSPAPGLRKGDVVITIWGKQVKAELLSDLVARLEKIGAPEGAEGEGGNADMIAQVSASGDRKTNLSATVVEQIFKLRNEQGGNALTSALIDNLG